MGNARVVVIGGGVAGYCAALRSARLGAEVSLVEKEQIGGVCVNKGCIPTKVYLHGASLFGELKRATRFGVNAENITFDFHSLVARKRAVVDRVRGAIPTLLRSKNIRQVNGTAAFIDSKKVRIIEAEEVIPSDKFILASGSVPASLPITDGKTFSC